MEGTKHIPVLLEETIAGLHLTNGDVVVDATLGGGGHARVILEQVAPRGVVVAFDADREALERFEKRAVSEPALKQALHEKRLLLVRQNYSELVHELDHLGITAVKAILADLGFSSDQIEAGERGLSFQKEGPLDMRLDQSTVLRADTIVNTYSEEALVKILREFGDEPQAQRIARAIVEERSKQPIATTHELRTLIEVVYPKRLRALLKIHPATRTFQALRIAVNQEFEHLERFLGQALERLIPGGRLAIITFHSGEDKRVKQVFRTWAQGCVCPPGFPLCRCGSVAAVKILTKKPLVASKEEQRKNPRSRSAKLRIVEKL